MPELPEVETNRHNFASWATGRRIKAVSPPPGTRETAGVQAEQFARRLQGRRVEDVTRRGKWILVRLSGGGALGIHLGMTGKLVRLDEPAEPLPRFTRAVLTLDDNTRVCFVDARRFGKLIAEPSYELLIRRREIAQIGPDALSELDESFLSEVLARSSRNVKEAIMDQRIAAGVGNLHATEALWRAGIHPMTPASAVAADHSKISDLLDGIRSSLRLGLATFNHVAAPVYIEEGGPNPFGVYDKAGRPCPRCRARIASVVIGGRTTAFCPKCQPLLGLGDESKQSTDC